MDFICTISSFLITSFGHLTFLEKVLCTTHMMLVILFFLIPFARHVLSCFFQASCNTNTTTDTHIASRTCSSWFKLSALCCVYMLFLQIAVLGNAILILLKSGIGQDESWYCSLYVSILQVVAWLVLSISILCSWFKPSMKQPFLVRLWWVVSFALCVLVGYIDLKQWCAGKLKPSSLTVANFLSFPALVFLCVAAVRGFTGIDVVHTKGNIHEPLLLVEENNGPRATHYDSATILGLLTLSWVSPILAKGANRPLHLNDVPLLPSRYRSETSYRPLICNWEIFKLANPNKNPSLAMVILRSFWKEAAWYAVFATLDTLASYVGPYLVCHFVDYLSGKEATSHKGFLVAVIFVAMLIENLTARQWSMGAELIGMHVKSALTAMVYKKGLWLTSSARKSHTSGVIVHYMSVDVQRIGEFALKIFDIWNLPLQIILGVAILYKSVGHAYVATLVAIAISILVTIPLTRIQNHYQNKLMAAKGERLRKTSECVRNMRVLKLHAWEERYRLKVEELRKVEQRWLKSSSYLEATMTFVLWASPIFVAVVTFSTSMLLGNKQLAASSLPSQHPKPFKNP